MGKLLSIFAAQACRPPSTSKIDFVLSFDFSIFTAICESRPRRQIQTTKTETKNQELSNLHDEVGRKMFNFSYFWDRRYSVSTSPPSPERSLHSSPKN